MKKILLFLLLFTGIVNGQIVNIPDANFKNFLITRQALTISNIIAPIDENDDNEISLYEASIIKSLPTVQSNTSVPISSLVGIETFQNLQVLNVIYSTITYLDLSMLQNLSTLDLQYNNSLTSINLNGLNNLKYLNCNNNSLTNLDLSSNSLLINVDCNFNQISNLILGSNINLVNMKCASNLISILDISQLINLNYLYCPNNQISILEITNLINLENLDCSNNLLNSLIFTNLINLKSLNCGSNNLSNLNLSNSHLLTTISCYSNVINLLIIPITNVITTLNCGGNILTDLNLLNLPNLKTLSCSGNLITSLDFTNSQILENLYFGYSPYNSINLTPLLNLKSISYGANTNNLLIDFSPLISLENFSLRNTNFSTINLNSNIHLKDISIYNTVLSTLEISNCIELNTINFSNNPNFNSLDFSSFPNLKSYRLSGLDLTNLFLKNGIPIMNISISGCQNLQFICCNLFDIQRVKYAISTGSFNNQANVNSYCSFTPGGNFNTISGNIKFDANNNGCDISDIPLPNIRVNINDGTTTGASFSSNLGNYGFFTQAGNFDITPEIENSTWFTISPITATIPFADNNNNLANQNFCITANGVHNDLEVIISPITPSRPGFDADYNIVYKNKGNQTLSGDVSLNYDDDVLDFISSTITPTSTSLGNLSWTYTNLLPFESKSIDVKFNVNSPTETPAINIGDILNFNVNITPLTGDELPNDNSFNFNQIVVGSFDPNDITCLEGNSVAPSTIGEYLHYAINFENTGNFPAENIVVKATIDPSKFNINSLQLLNTSNPVDARINGNVVEFIFKNIQLGSGGHGHILLKMKTNNILNSGDNVSKRADIFFDYNFPIDTGFAVTVFQNLSNTVFVIDNSVSISPNPTSSKVNINSNNNIKSIEVYDVQGRILQTILNANNLDLSDKTNGIYFLKITTEKGSKIEKVVKE